MTYLTWPPSPGASLGQEEGTVLQALGAAQSLCSSSEELGACCLEAAPLLQLSQHPPGYVVTCLHASYVFCYFLAVHSHFPPVTWSETFNKSGLSPNQNGEERRNR